MPTGTSGQGLPRAARAVIGTTLVGGALTLGLLAALAARTPLAWTIWPLIAAIAIATFALQRRGFVLHWRGQRFTPTFDEPALLIGFLVLPPALAAIALVAGVLAAQLVARRAPVKAAFNVASYTLSTTAAVGAFLGAQLAGAHLAVAITAGAFAVTIVSNVILSTLFGALEGTRAARVFADRFALVTLANAGIGASIVICAWALWMVHPLATLALAPLAALAFIVARALTRLDREARLRTRLEEATRALLDSPDESALAERILHECGDMFLAGRAELRLARGADGAPRSWTAEFEGGAEDLAKPLEASLLGRDKEPLGTIRVFPARRAPTANDAMLDAPLLRLFATEAAGALERAAVVRRHASLASVHQRIVRHAPAGIVRLDQDAQIAEVNAFFAESVGAARETWSAMLGDTAFADAISGAMTGRTFHGIEVRARGKVFDVAGVPLPPEENESGTGALILFQDVSARQVAEEAQRKHSVTRPLVRRIVIELVREGVVPERLLVSLGRQLAGEIEASTPEEYAAAFRVMGLGELRATGPRGAMTAFAADDLIERRHRTKLPTCHLTRGYLEGVVEALEGHPSLGSEVKCQSQGHARCEFLVKAKPVAEARARVR